MCIMNNVAFIGVCKPLWKSTNFVSNAIPGVQYQILPNLRFRESKIQLQLKIEDLETGVWIAWKM